MNFAEAARNTAALTRTENGALALNTTGSKLLDLFGVIGSLREADELRITRLFADAYSEDPLSATKIVFYARDVRMGLGERRTPRILLKYMAQYHPEALVNNIKFIGEYGRWDDLYELIGTPLEDKMWKVMKDQFDADFMCVNDDSVSVSLLAKWIKTADASSDKTRKLGILTAIKLGYPVKEFKRMVRALRQKIRIVEAAMSANNWSEIDYSAVPSRASMIYRKAFERHDSTRYSQFINKAISGEAKINSSTLYPYDLIEKVFRLNWSGRPEVKKDDVVEALWKQLPDYVGGDFNAIVIADTSGSMAGRPLSSAVGLAVYFAERNKGAYHNMWMSFSNKSNIHVLKGETLAQKLESIETNDWDMNTNLEAAFDKILDIGIKNNVPPEEMVKSITVVSDMEIDRCASGSWIFYDAMAKKFHEAGYEIPNIIFWNVNSRHDVYHVDKSRKGVQLFSGQSASTFKQIMSLIGMNPVEAMFKTINSERYEPITIAEKA